MTPRSASRAAALLIGDELLSGKVREANLHHLAKTLRSLGISLVRVVMVGDDTSTIAQEMRLLSESTDLLITSGGVGPTHDDLTLEALSLAFEVSLVEDPATRALIERSYPGSTTKAHLRMARVPQGSELATIPGVEWPTVVFGNIWLFPGVPEIFRMKLDVLRAWVRGPRPYHSKAIVTQVEEPELVPLLDAIASRFPDVCVGSYPKWFDPSYKTRITFDGRNEASVSSAFASLLGQLAPNAIVAIE